MSDESRPDNLEDLKPDLDEQALVGTGNEEQDDLDTAHEMETIVPSTEQPDSRNSATIQGVERPQKPVVLEGEAIPGPRPKAQAGGCAQDDPFRGPCLGRGHAAFPDRG